ncbi:glutamate ABC transporter substrate-binding protein [Kribbella sp. VKM Ac-2566]|uniref:glutamate ABC transporter substrate-binding protein n=1 Tax=Kribbella sp. VKM Ac-2566 TaxID=2512218 RepID=UPI00106327B2|nr:glutamate ABC transporter substrate-binding protein [Kribbella sp. VKM Ac-2566]TDW89065.1 amino acid ABC transporter substrate-binding protein (PAAT family) [Kribbella sp. VKM Ac-2566]
MKKLIPLAATTALLLTACGNANYTTTQIPPEPQAPASSAAPAATQPCSAAEKAAELKSYEPEPTLPAPMQMPASSTMKKIQARGRLIAGVSADSLHLGSRNPISGHIEGFDIDMVKAVARAIFGTEVGHLELRVISSPQRIPSLENNSVDIVARNMTINCERWKRIAFSAEYYRSGQKTLVQRDSTATKLADLSGQTICAPAGSTSLDNLKKANPKIKPVTADTDTGCLVLFQQGKADGISGDDTVLAGDAAQDPYAKVLTERISDEPYGLGINKKNIDFVRFVNGVLAQMKTPPAAGGLSEWMKSYNAWLGTDLGELKAPPTPAYGR